MKSTNPNAGMGFTEDDEEDEEDMNMSRSSVLGELVRLRLHRLHPESRPMILLCWTISA